MTVPNRIIEKIKKCFALSESSEPHEAAAALRQARKLMDKYKLEQGDALLSDLDDSLMDTGYKKVPVYMQALLIAAFSAFKVSIVFSRPSVFHGRKTTQLTLIGDATGIEIATHVLAQLTRQLEDAREAKRAEFKDKGHVGKDLGKLVRRYSEGWSMGVHKTVMEFAGSLTVEDTEEHLDYLAKKHDVKTKTKTERSAKRRGTKAEADAYKNGHTEGRKANIYAGVKESEQKRLAG